MPANNSSVGRRRCRRRARWQSRWSWDRAPGDALAPVDRTTGEIAIDRARHRLPQAQRGTGGCIDLVAVMRLDDFDVIAVLQHVRGKLGQLHQEIHAHAHIRRKHDGDPLRSRGNVRLAGVIEAGGADDHGSFAATQASR